MSFTHKTVGTIKAILREVNEFHGMLIAYLNHVISNSKHLTDYNLREYLTVLLGIELLRSDGQATPKTSRLIYKDALILNQ